MDNRKSYKRPDIESAPFSRKQIREIGIEYGELVTKALVGKNKLIRINNGLKEIEFEVYPKQDQLKNCFITLKNKNLGPTELYFSL